MMIQQTAGFALKQIQNRDLDARTKVTQGKQFLDQIVADAGPCDQATFAQVISRAMDNPRISDELKLAGQNVAFKTLANGLTGPAGAALVALGLDLDKYQYHDQTGYLNTTGQHEFKQSILEQVEREGGPGKAVAHAANLVGEANLKPSLQDVSSNWALQFIAGKEGNLAPDQQVVAFALLSSAPLKEGDTPRMAGYMVPLRGDRVVADTTPAEFAETNSGYNVGKRSMVLDAALSTLTDLGETPDAREAAHKVQLETQSMTPAEANEAKYDSLLGILRQTAEGLRYQSRLQRLEELG